MARMMRSLYHGKDWKEGGKKIVAHRVHRVHPNRKKRNRLGAPRFERERGNKLTQKWREARKREIQHHKFVKWQQAHPNATVRENPFRVQPPPFHNFEMRDALIAAGVFPIRSHMKHE